MTNFYLVFYSGDVVNIGVLDKLCFEIVLPPLRIERLASVANQLFATLNILIKSLIDKS